MATLDEYLFQPEMLESNNENTFSNLFQNKSILIVDDDELITSLYARILTPTSANVVIHNNPIEAFKVALTCAFDLIIIDYRMPEMTGHQFLMDLISSKQKMPKTIISTANAMFDEEAKNELKAFDDVIFKPFTKVSFLNTIAKVLELSPAVRADEITLDDKKSTVSINLNALINYVGDDLKDLVEILEIIVVENEKSLSDFKQAIDLKNTETIAHVIHQLSSRFSQVDQNLTLPTHEIEAELRENNSDLDFSPIQKLYTNWINYQQLIKDKLTELKKKLDNY